MSLLSYLKAWRKDVEPNHVMVKQTMDIDGDALYKSVMRRIIDKATEPRDMTTSDKARADFILGKDMTASDVHVSSTAKPKKKKPLDGQPDEDNLPVKTSKYGGAEFAESELALRQCRDKQANKWVPGVTMHCNEDTAPSTSKFAEVLKVDESLGLVLGWAIVCKKDGQPYFDLQQDYIPEDSMLKAAVDFMQNSRVAKEMHNGESMGTVLFAFPMTEDIAKAFGVETKTTGLMIAMKPDSADMLAKFKDGTLTGFSIGGIRLDDEEVD